MTPITYLVGDATKPDTSNPHEHHYILHICNDAGGWGAGFVLALSKRWSKPEEEYRKLAEAGPLVLGTNQFVQVEKNITVVNMIAQHSFGSKGRPPIRYWAVRQCLEDVQSRNDDIWSKDSIIHMPRIGCGLAGGHWDEIEPMICSVFSRNDDKVFVYDFGG